MANEKNLLNSVRLQWHEVEVRIHVGFFYLFLGFLLQGQQCGFFGVGGTGGLKRVQRRTGTEQGLNCSPA